MGRIIFINRYYKPDHSATAQLLTELAEHLAKTDREIIIVTSQLQYENNNCRLKRSETLSGVLVKRIWTTAFGRRNLAGRAIDYLSFYLSCFFTLLILVNKTDTVVAKTDPPMISVIAGLVARIKRAKLINWVQDLFPEVAGALAHKELSGPLMAYIKYIRNRSLKIAHNNIVIGKLMAEKLHAQGIHLKQMLFIPNWVVGEDIKPICNTQNQLIDEWELRDKFVIGYSGNLGLAHDYTTILATIERLRHHNEIHFLFIGSGAGMDLLKETIHEKNIITVSFKPYQPIEMLSTSLSVPDVHLITLQKELEGLIVPSKFYGVLSVNKPILYIGSNSGELGSLINANHCGAVFESGDVDGICRWLLDVSNDREKLAALCRSARQLQQDRFNKYVSLNLWSEALRV